MCSSVFLLDFMRFWFGVASSAWKRPRVATHHHHPRQMPHSRHYDPHVEGKLLGTALIKELPLKEHARPFTELNDRACHAFLPKGKMRRGVECNVIKFCDLTNLLHALRTGILAGHDAPAQIESNSIFAIYPTVLAEGVDSRQILP